MVYCMEEIDNEVYFNDPNEAYLLPGGFNAEYSEDLLNGVVSISGTASFRNKGDLVDITAIPYYAWSNRGQGQMKVWLPCE